jgi:hypothetical protein
MGQGVAGVGHGKDDAAFFIRWSYSHLQFVILTSASRKSWSTDNSYFGRRRRVEGVPGPGKLECSGVVRDIGIFQ